MDIVFKREYKGIEMQVICEDDLLTTAKAFNGDECVSYFEVGNDDHPNGLPCNQRCVNAVYAELMSDIDAVIAESEAEEAA